MTERTETTKLSDNNATENGQSEGYEFLPSAAVTFAWNPHPMADEYVHYSPSLIMQALEPSRRFVLLNENGKEAVIDFSGDCVTFSGDLPVDEAARMFFEAVFGLLK